MDQPKHPYLLALFGLGSLLVITIVVQTHMPAPAMNTSNSLGTPIVFSSYDPAPYRANTPVAPSAQVSQNTSVNIPSDQNPSSFSYDTTPAPIPTKNTVATIISSDTAFDFNAFRQQLSGSAPKKPSPSVTPSTDLQETYPTVPPQLFTTVESAPLTRDSAQQTMYVYGNAAGSYIQNYDRMHPDDSGEVQRYFDSRGTTAHEIALKILGNDLKNIGVSMKTISPVPMQLASVHTALANSYIDIGEKLSLIPLAQSDDDLIKAINVYDDAVEVYAKNYTALVFKFAEHKVTFGSDEPGSLFMFAQ
jgi:hypothetical protein